VDEEVILSAANSTDPDGSATSLQVEWDLNGLGFFGPATTTKTLTNRFASPGDRLIRARLTDSSGARSISTPVALRVTLPALSISRQADAVQLSWTTNASHYVLQQSTKIPNSSAWAPATQAVTITGSQNRVLVTNPVPTQFFRLWAPASP
jgi:hypothetical protein